jgi:hypothetical protein
VGQASKDKTLKVMLIFAVLAVGAGGVAYGVREIDSESASTSDSSPAWESSNFVPDEPVVVPEEPVAVPEEPIFDIAEPLVPDEPTIESDCNDASWATHDDYRCGSAEAVEPYEYEPYEMQCNPASYATYDDYRCGGTGSDEYTEGCNPASYATYDDYRCGGTGSTEATEGCNPAWYATYDDYRCGGN